MAVTEIIARRAVGSKVFADDADPTKRTLVAVCGTRLRALCACPLPPSAVSKATVASATKAMSFVRYNRRATVDTAVMPKRPCRHRVVNLMVFLGCHYLKIIKAIVYLVAILVMNNLIRTKRATKVLFHDESVFKHIASTVRPDEDVSMRVGLDSALPIWVVGAVEPLLGFRCTINRTESCITALYPGARRGELLAAYLTDTRYPAGYTHAVVSAIPRAILGIATTIAGRRYSESLAATLARTFKLLWGCGIMGMHRNHPFRCRAGAVHAAPSFVFICPHYTTKQGAMQWL